MLKKLYAVSIISGTMIGVGFFALPYLTVKTSPTIILGYFVLLGTISIFIHYFYADLALKTPDKIRLPGFAKIYLGNNAYKIALISSIIGMIGINLAYLIVGGKFLSLIASPFFNYSETFYVLIYFALGSILIYFGIKLIGRIQLTGMVLFFLSIFLMFFKGKDIINFDNLVFEMNPEYFLVPYGVVLFSLWGLFLVPEAEEALKEKKESLKKIIPVTVIVPIIIYLFFIYLIVGITGNSTSVDALTGLQTYLASDVLFLVLVFAVMATFTSFISVGLTLKKVLWYDMKIKEKTSWAIACVLPITMYLVGLRDFIVIVSIVGGTMLVVEAILVALMYRKSKASKWRFLTYPIIFALVLSFIFNIIYYSF